MTNKEEVVDQFNKEREQVFFKGYQDIETTKIDKNAIIESDKDINVELVGWIQKFLYPYSLDPMPFKPKDVPI